MFFKSISSFKKKLWWLIIIPVGLITSLFSWHKVERDVFQIWKLVLGKRFICLFIYAFILFIHLIIHQSNARYVFGFSKWCAFCWMLKIKYKYTWFLLSRSLWLIVKKKKSANNHKVMIIAFIHPANKFLLNPYCETSTVLGIGIWWIGSLLVVQ